MAQQTEQTVAKEAPVSVEDRIGNQFERLFFGGDEQPEQPTKEEPEGEQEAKGEEPEAEAAEEAKPEEGSDDSVEVEFNGNSYRVPPELKDALMATSDYTKKTTEVSQLRKAVDLQHKELALFNEQRKFEAAQTADFDRLKMLNAYIAHESNLLGQNWQQMTRDARQDKQFELDRLEKDRNELTNTLKGKYDEFQAKQKVERDKIKSEMTERLSKSIPGWSAETQSALMKYVQDRGIPEVNAQNMSAIEAEIVWESMQYRKLKSEAKPVLKNAAAPTIKPSARPNPMPKDTQDKLNYRKALSKTSDPKARQKLAEDRIASIFGG